MCVCAFLQFSEDQEKCISILQKESENHYHPSQPFSDFRLPESKVNFMKNDYGKHFAETPYEVLPHLANLQNVDMSSLNKKQPSASGRSCSHAGVVHVPGKSLNPGISKQDSFSAPVITKSERPFSDIYKQNPVSSQNTFNHSPSNRSNQMIFHTTKNHVIEVPKSHETTAYIPVSGEPEQRHAVKLSITPSFPFQQQHINVFNNSVCTTASHSSRPGRHMTSVNFQLQPQSSDQLPLEISTIPTNIGSPCNSSDFGSHVQISLGTHGATFTAVRLQHPVYSQTQNKSQPPIIEEYPEHCTPSSQAQNSSVITIPKKGLQLSPVSGANQPPFKHPSAQSQNMYASQNLPNAQIGSIPSYQSSRDYILGE